jgi:ATP-dependent DNA ligase
MPAVKTKAHFIEPMLLRRTAKLPEGCVWAYELKLDGRRKQGGRIE